MWEDWLGNHDPFLREKSWVGGNLSWEQNMLNLDEFGSHQYNWWLNRPWECTDLDHVRYMYIISKLFLHHVFFSFLTTNRQPPIHPPAKCRQVALHHTQWDSLVLQSYLSCHPGGYDCIPGKVAPLQIPCCSDLPATSLVNFHGVSFRWCEKYFSVKISNTK